MEAKHDYSEKLGLADIVVGVIAGPVAVMREISREHYLPLAIMVYFFSALVANASSVLADTAVAQLVGGVIPTLLVMTAAALFYLFVHGIMIFALARLFRCRGSLVTLLSLLAVSNVPSLFIAPLALVRLRPGLPGEILYGLGMFILAIWVSVLGIFAIRETFQLSTGRAVMLYLLPLFLVLVLLMFAVFLVLAVQYFQNFV